MVVEEFLDGEEASFFAFIDGESCVPLVGAQARRCRLLLACPPRLLLGARVPRPALPIPAHSLPHPRPSHPPTPAPPQDHKAVGEGDTGPNTGGMGSYSPAPVLTPALQEAVMRDIVLPTARGMCAEGSPFRGVLFAGLMIKDGQVGGAGGRRGGGRGAHPLPLTHPPHRPA